MKGLDINIKDSKIEYDFKNEYYNEYDGGYDHIEIPQYSIYYTSNHLKIACYGEGYYKRVCHSFGLEGDIFEKIKEYVMW